MTAFERNASAAPDKRGVLACAVAFAILTTAAPAAWADDRRAGSPWQSGKGEPTLIHVSGKKALNLLTVVPKPRKRHTVRATLGHGSYVCGPSGFGQRSRCRKN